jgi:putative lipoprotein
MRMDRAPVRALRVLLLSAALAAGVAVSAQPPSPTPTDHQAAQPATVSGAVVADHLAISPDAIVTVRLLDISRADAPALKLAEVELSPKQRGSVPFQLEYSLGAIDPRHTYVVAAEVREHDVVIYRSQGVRVLTRGGSTYPIEVFLEPVGPAGPHPAATGNDEAGGEAAGGAAGSAPAPGPVLGTTSPIPEDALAGVPDAGWARDLADLRPALTACLAHRPAQAQRVVTARRSESGATVARLAGAPGARFECSTAPGDEARVVAWRRLASDAPAVAGEGEVIFTPPAGRPPAGACYRHSAIVSGGRPGGWLSRKQC